MPNLTISVTAAQATRIRNALIARYVGTALETASLADQAQDFILVAVRQLVADYERGQAVAQAVSGTQEL